MACIKFLIVTNNESCLNYMLPVNMQVGHGWKCIDPWLIWPIQKTDPFDPLTDDPSTHCLLCCPELNCMSAPCTACTYCTMDSSSLGDGCRLRANTTQQGRYPAYDDALTSLAATVSIDMLMPYDPLRANTGWAKKPDCFSDLITFWRLVLERRAVCQNFLNFIQKKLQNLHFSEF